MANKNGTTNGRSNGLYRVRSNGPNTYGIGLPRAIGEKLMGRTFSVNIREEGILFTPVTTPQHEDTTQQLEAASWA